MMGVQHIKDLKAWQKSMDLVELIYAATKNFPPDERFGLSSQMQRAAVSIPSNIAEGFGRGSKGDFLRFLMIARGSLLELGTQLEISRRLRYILDEQVNQMESQIEDCGRVIKGLARSLEDARNRVSSVRETCQPYEKLEESLSHMEDD